MSLEFKTTSRCFSFKIFTPTTLVFLVKKIGGEFSLPYGSTFLISANKSLSILSKETSKSMSIYSEKSYS